jgi:hypothetical protein
MSEFEQKEERRGFVRLPMTLYVDSVDIEPDMYFGRVVRTAYDLELTTYDMRVLHDEIKKRLEAKTVTPMRIRVIGRLVA